MRLLLGQRMYPLKGEGQQWAFIFLGTRFGFKKRPTFWWHFRKIIKIKYAALALFYCFNIIGCIETFIVWFAKEVILWHGY